MYRIADVVIVRDKRVLLVQQRKASAYGLWSCPGGQLEPSETPEEAVKREVREELGVELKNVQPFKIYHTGVSGVELETNTFTGDFETEISLNTDELMAYCWFTQADLLAAPETLRGNGAVILKQVKDVFKRSPDEKQS